MRVQLLKTPAAMRTKNMLRVAKDIKYKRILTGTPVTKSPLDIFAQFAFLVYKDSSTNNYYAFRARYAKVISKPTSSGRTFPLIIGYQRLDELDLLIKSNSYRVKKKIV